MSEVVNIDTGYEPEPEEPQDWVIKEQLVRDLVTGLTLRFRSGSDFMILSLYGDCLEFGVWGQGFVLCERMRDV